MRWLSCAALLFVSSANSSAADAKPQEKIEGRWRVSSVELAGMQVPGLDDAELELADGKKVFTLPGGRVEKGTYRVDAAKEPGEIDVTTEGRDGNEKGIYTIEKDALKICLATKGGPRPSTLTTKAGTDQILIVLRRSAAKPAESPSAEVPSARKPVGTRSFRMGFTGFVYDITLEAVTQSRKFCHENGDLIAQHIEGVPWAEALSGQPFRKAILEEWEGKKSATPPKGKVYLAISPGRGDLKLADKGGPLPKELTGKAYDDPLVLKAYLNYCRRAIEYFRPDYLTIGIEVNEIHDAGPKAWNAYIALHKHVYTELKKEHPELPIFASWTLHNMFKKRGSMLESWKELMPWNDMIAVSYYPFFMSDGDRLASLDWMTSEFDSFQKPYAMVETGDAAERLPLPSAKVVIEGTPEKQESYFRALLGLAQKHHFEFVVSFVHQDYDALWERIKDTSPELFIAWRDCGLVDERGRVRPAYRIWKQYLDLPFRK